MTTLIVPEDVPGYARSRSTQFHRSPPHSREQIARWQAALEERIPRTKHLSWLYLRWEAGDEWQPIQRYVLWEMIPNETESKPGTWIPCVPDGVRADLEGPSPRTTGHYDPKQRRWVGGASKTGHVDLSTWEVFHETGRLFGEKQWGMRYWVIQGAHGGHPLHEPHAVNVVRRLLNPDAPETVLPPLGDLPYAPPDNRVFDKLVGYDKYRQWRYNVDYAFRNQAHIDAEERANAEKAAVNMMAWFDASVGEVLQEYSRHLANVGWEAKGASRGNEIPVEDQEQTTTERMIEVFR